MESKTIKEIKNESLGRTEYLLDVVSENNPSKNDIISILKSEPELTVVRSIKGSFGKKIFSVDVVIYNTKEDKDRVETIPRKVRKKLAEEAKKAAEAAPKQ